ncbi:MAG: dihydroorotate dehydrogenase [Acidobacteriaceae bacterium]
MTASGTYGFGEEYSAFYPLSRLGALCVKGTTLHPRQGNPPPRIHETPGGMLNSIGLQNPGVDGVIEQKLSFLRDKDVPIIVNISGETVQEYVEIATRLDACGLVSALELNISCPNVAAGGRCFGMDARLTHEVVTAVRKVTDLTLISKLSPNVTDIVEIGRASMDAGADALSVINTVLGAAFDIRRRKPVLSRVVGGLSGPAIKPIALAAVWQVASAISAPIIGMGGIMTGDDAVEFLLAGATAVAVGTANFVTPTAAVDVIDGIRSYLLRHEIRDVRALVRACVAL